jgi:hypothetical protein
MKLCKFDSKFKEWHECPIWGDRISEINTLMSRHPYEKVIKWLFCEYGWFKNSRVN